MYGVKRETMAYYLAEEISLTLVLTKWLMMLVMRR